MSTENSWMILVMREGLETLKSQKDRTKLSVVVKTGSIGCAWSVAVVLGQPFEYYWGEPHLVRSTPVHYLSL